ncbi:hypothetical protein PV721_00850 [Streptomyces sp. MB09-01]|uniref:hypothetical protein n=1 Tax=Streptomyces sp. MB09-01 TaxID=3028666 RepID=UPI0029A1B935|nr:hypothetical protein [Streptomyces sp. MB09-01]MDX3532945.1 hypothetical protein [Streptomyces sp. MB09-01]
MLRGTFHAYELAALTAAARYVVESSPADVPEESIGRLTQLLAEYDEQVRKLSAPGT